MRNPSFILIPLLVLVFAITGCRTPQTSPAVLADPQVLAAAQAVKLQIHHEGLYRVPLTSLGWDESGVERITLRHKEQLVPFEVQGQGENAAIIFFGQASDSPYTPHNFYILEQNGAAPKAIAIQAASEPAQAANHLFRTLHLEENYLYVPKVSEGNTWHWLKIVAPQAQTVEFELNNLADQPAHLRAALWGVTSAPTIPNHHVRLRLNGQTLGEATWEGQTWQMLDLEIPAGLLQNGQNTLEIQATGEIEAPIDIINLDWVEIEYPQKADQPEPQQIFRVPEGGVQISGFEGPLTLYEISNPSEISRLSFASATTETLTFTGNPDQRYLSVTLDGHLQPEQILPLAAEPDLRAASGADYLAIGHPALLAPLEPLLQARRAQGLSTLSVPVEAIYDQFNGGLAEPEAIRAFLAFAHQNWGKPPAYVLLVGDASYDFRGYQTPVEASFIPTFMVQTVFGGETGSDVRLAQLSSDLTPTLAIGRVPARTPEQVKIFVEKTLSYEESSPQATWNRLVLAVADGQEAVFAQDASRFLEQFSADFETEMIAPQAGAQGTNEQIGAEIESGTFVTAYFGHGSVNMWGKDSLFTTQDSAALENEDRLPLVLNFTCLTGLFTHPTEESLAESFLFNPQGGAVAVLAPTSPTLPTDQSFLSAAVVSALSQAPIPRLGDVTLYAWQQVPTQSSSSIDVMQTFLLFGDPALVLP